MRGFNVHSLTVGGSVAIDKNVKMIFVNFPMYYRGHPKVNGFF
jgi:hypothetical protein